MPEIDITDIGSIRSAYQFKRFVWDFGREITYLFQCIFANVILGILVSMGYYMIEYYNFMDDVDKAIKTYDLSSYFLIIFLPQNFLPYFLLFMYYMYQLALMNECFDGITYSLNSSRIVINSLYQRIYDHWKKNAQMNKIYDHIYKCHMETKTNNSFMNVVRQASK